MAGRHAGQYDDDFAMPLMMMMIQSLNSRLPVLQNVFVPPHNIRVVCSVMVVNLTTGNGQVLSIMKILMMMMLRHPQTDFKRVAVVNEQEATVIKPVLGLRPCPNCLMTMTTIIWLFQEVTVH